MKTAPKATIVCDLQFGSTGKGLIAGYIAKRDKPDVVMTAWSANAGHTFIDENGRKFVHCMLANGVVSPNLQYVLIGPGSQMNWDLFLNEVDQCRDLLKGKTIYVHQSAAIITQAHVEEEAGPMTKIGSTKKGCGAAMIAKIRRNPDDQNTAGAMAGELLSHPIAGTLLDDHIMLRIVDNIDYLSVVYGAQRILVEGAQGFSLGINNGFYPYVTSRECTPAQIAVDVNLPLAFIDKVVGTMRTYPIRVANRFNDKGEQIGWSGPSYPDQRELDWSELGKEAELTTVTKLPRRIFEFSEEQTRHALAVVRPDEVFLNFVNYADDVDPSGDIRDSIINTIERVAEELSISPAYTHGGYYVKYLGYGATVRDVVELDDEHGEVTPNFGDANDPWAVRNAVMAVRSDFREMK